MNIEKSTDVEKSRKKNPLPKLKPVLGEGDVTVDEESRRRRRIHNKELLDKL